MAIRLPVATVARRWISYQASFGPTWFWASLGDQRFVGPKPREHWATSISKTPCIPGLHRRSVVQTQLRCSPHVLRWTKTPNLAQNPPCGLSLRQPVGPRQASHLLTYSHHLHLTPRNPIGSHARAISTATFLQRRFCAYQLHPAACGSVAARFATGRADPLLSEGSRS